MGLQLRTPVGRQIILLKKINMNKFLAVVCLATGAMAEAKADPYYAAYGYAGLPVAGAYGAGVYGAGAYGAGAYGAYGAYPYGLGHAAGYASVSPSASVSINGLDPAAVPAIAGAYAGAGRYVANSAGVVHVAKREAEAEAEPYYAAYGYAGLPVASAYAGAHAGTYGAYGAYGAGVYGAGAYSAGVYGAGAYGAGVYGAGAYGAYGAYPYAAYSGYSNVSPSAALNIAGAAPAAVPAAPGLPAAGGRYCANSAGVVHCA